MAEASFFDESTEQSQVKATIVSKYFWAWATVMLGVAQRNPRRASNRIAYIDLFCGPGCYKDGTPSTPIKVLEQAIAHPQMRRMLVTIFNDIQEDYCNRLERAIQELPGIGTLRFRPQIWNEEVGSNIVRRFDQSSMIPTLFFIDPWGYKGLSLPLINSTLKDWGCDCIFFFNYNRVNMHLANPLANHHLDDLFGGLRAQRLREKVVTLPSEQRELTVVEEMCQAIKATGSRYVLPFCFKNDAGYRTSHYLIFVSKALKGYEIMKDIMAKESSSTNQGVPSFEYAPASPQQSLLFELSRPLDSLAEQLLGFFAGRTLTVEEIYNQHHVDRPFIRKNYKATLLALESQGKVQVYSSAERRRRRETMADHLTVIFPPR